MITLLGRGSPASFDTGSRARICAHLVACAVCLRLRSPYGARARLLAAVTGGGGGPLSRSPYDDRARSRTLPLSLPRGLAVRSHLTDPAFRSRRGHWRIRACRSRDRLAVIARAACASAPARTFRSRASDTLRHLKTLAPCSLAAPIIACVADTLRHRLRSRRSSRPDVFFRSRSRAPRDARARLRIETCRPLWAAFADREIPTCSFAVTRWRRRLRRSRLRSVACTLRCPQSIARETHGSAFRLAFSRVHLAMPAFDRGVDAAGVTFAHTVQWALPRAPCGARAGVVPRNAAVLRQPRPTFARAIPRGTAGTFALAQTLRPTLTRRAFVRTLRHARPRSHEQLHLAAQLPALPRSPRPCGPDARAPRQPKPFGPGFRARMLEPCGSASAPRPPIPPRYRPLTGDASAQTLRFRPLRDASAQTLRPRHLRYTNTQALRPRHLRYANAQTLRPRHLRCSNI